jgi:hypothetical protein
MATSSTAMSAAATRSLIMRHKVVHLPSLASIMPIKKEGVKGEEEIAPTLQGASWLYSPNCREGLFSEIRLLEMPILGK